MSASALNSDGHVGLAQANLIGVHHIGIPVRNIEQSLAWYRQLFGLEPDFIEISEGPDTSRIVQLDDVRLRFAFLQLPNVIIELLEYEHPVGADFDRRNCDVGAIHVCLEVDDIDRVYRLLSEQGVAFSTSGPIAQVGPLEGQACCYFRDPDGIQLELWERPR